MTPLRSLLAAGLLAAGLGAGRPPAASDAPATSAAVTLAAPPSEARRVASLPLVVVGAPAGGAVMAVFYSGDGGWADIDRGVAGDLARAGVPVVGYNTLRYFWTPRTPDAAAGDLAAVLKEYMTAWRRPQVILAGYSFGADALPAIVARLPPDLRSHVRLLALLGASRTGALEFHPREWLNLKSRGGYALAPVLAQLGDMPRICIYGDREINDACPGFPPGAIRAVRAHGGHHFAGDYTQLSEAILKAAGLPAAR